MAENHERVRQALAESTATLRTVADRYVQIMARAQREIDHEKSLPNPSQFRIESLSNIRDRAEENIARFKAGPARLPEWLTKEIKS